MTELNRMIDHFGQTSDLSLIQVDRGHEDYETIAWIVSTIQKAEFEGRIGFENRNVRNIASIVDVDPISGSQLKAMQAQLNTSIKVYLSSLDTVLHIIDFGLSQLQSTDGRSMKGNPVKTIITWLIDTPAGKIVSKNSRLFANFETIVHASVVRHINIS